MADPKDRSRASSPAPQSGQSGFTRRSLLVGAGGAALSEGLASASARMAKPQHILVVGAGVFGAWSAHHLLQAGFRVTLVDAFGPAHSRASSGGESRMTRAAYGKDSIYTRMAFDSLAQWKRLGLDAGLPIFVPHGVLFFTASPDAYFSDSLRVHSELGLPIEQLGRMEMQRRFPMIDFAGVELGLFEPGFGALMARRAVQTLVDRFVRAGGTHVRARVAPPPEEGSRLDHVETDDGRRIGADQFVFAAGPWLPKLFPRLLGKRIFATRQDVFFFAPPGGDRRFLPEAMPGWADFNAGDIFYGFPDLENRGVKFAHDAHGPLVDPDSQSRLPNEEALARVVAFRDRRFPALKGAPLTEARVCQYENSSNGDFLIDRHPDMANVMLVGGGSGHGFKHGPEVGRHVADRIAGRGVPEPRFSLAGKGESQKREVH